MNLTVAYITARRDPKIEWFANSLTNQVNGNWPNIVIVDSNAKTRSIPVVDHPSYIHTPPKPTVWQGEHRLTKEDWWAVSNANNTALCLCKTDWIAYVDDISVLMPGWLMAVAEAMKGNYIAAGAYKKVKNLKVENGVPISYDEFPEGVDHRLALSKQDVTSCRAGWLFGCSCAFPTEALLEVGGWPEYCDGLGAQDYILGIALKNSGYDIKYDRRMMTLESEELHFAEAPMKKKDKGTPPNDKSHAALNIATDSKYFPNYYPGGMRALRDYVLAGNEFPVVLEPKHDWFDNEPIAQME